MYNKYLAFFRNNTTITEIIRDRNGSDMERKLITLFGSGVILFEYRFISS